MALTLAPSLPRELRGEPSATGPGKQVLTRGPVLQMAYQAWVTNAQTVLRRRRQEQAQRPVGESG